MVFSAFFSGMEIAFVSSNRMLAEMDKEKQKFSGYFLQTFYRHPNNFVSTMLVGNNIALVVYGILFAELFDRTLFKGMDATFTVPADTILSTLIVLFTGEFLPKTLFKSNANRLLSFFAFPAYLCYVVLWPISRFSTMLSRVILRIFGFKIEKEKNDDAFTKVHSNDKARDELRKKIVSDYVKLNGLNVTQYQDYGWDPVQLDK